MFADLEDVLVHLFLEVMSTISILISVSRVKLMTWMTTSKSWKVQAILCCLDCLKATLQNSEPSFSTARWYFWAGDATLCNAWITTTWLLSIHISACRDKGISGCYGCKKGRLHAAALCPGSAVVDHRQVWLVMRLLPGGGLGSWSYCSRETGLWSWVWCVLSCSSCQAVGASETNNAALFL